MKILKLPHRIVDYLCPINGLADIYEWKTGERIPDEFLFYAGSGFMLISQRNMKPPKMINLSTLCIGKMQYDFWSEFIGYKVISKQGKNFKNTLKDIKILIDEEIPVILFGLDMFYLEYQEKFYYKQHIPGHVILMVGYDDKYIYVHDNSKNDIQKVSVYNLELAWKEGYLNISKKNAYFGIKFKDMKRNRKEIIDKAFINMAERFLNPPVGFMGIKGIEKMIKELPKWEKEYSKETISNIYRTFMQFAASVLPELPRKLNENTLGIDNPHKGTRDRFGKSLYKYGREFNEYKWIESAKEFEVSASIIEKITDKLCEDVVNNYFNDVEENILLFRELCESEKRAYSKICGK